MSKCQAYHIRGSLGLLGAKSDLGTGVDDHPHQNQGQFAVGNVQFSGFCNDFPLRCTKLALGNCQRLKVVNHRLWAGKGSFSFMRKINLVLLSVSLITTFFAIEFMVRVFIPIVDPQRRFLMWSSQHFQLDRRNAVKYLENENVRSVAVYDNSIEYDVTYRTNNFGLIDHENYVPNRDRKDLVQQYAFVGNSFTAGIHGGDPWVPELRDRIKTLNSDVDIYNLGVSGTGPQHWRRLLNSVSQQIEFTDIVILAISSDLYRPFWEPITSKTEIKFDSYLIATIIDYNSTRDEILNHVKERVKEEKRERGASHGFVYNAKVVLKHSHFLRCVNRLLRRIKGKSRKEERFKDNLNALRNIKASFPFAKIHLIHLPEKEEIKTNTYKIDLKNEIESLGIKYFPALTECVWSEKMFYLRDSHPNFYGYRDISECVSKLMKF